MIGSDAPYYGAFLAPDAARGALAVDRRRDRRSDPAERPRPARSTAATSSSGRWAFGSGCTHADVIVGGCLVMDGDAPRVRRRSARRRRRVRARVVVERARHVAHDRARGQRLQRLHGHRPVRARAPRVPLQRSGAASRAAVRMAGHVLHQHGRASRSVWRGARSTRPSRSCRRRCSFRRWCCCATRRAPGSRSRGPKRSSARRARTCTTRSTGSGTRCVAGDEPSIEIRVAVALSRAHSFRVAREVAEIDERPHRRVRRSTRTTRSSDSCATRSR